MSKVFSTDSFCVTNGDMDFIPRRCTIEVNTDKNTLEFRVLYNEEVKQIRASLDKVKELLEEAYSIGMTFLKEDPENQSIIRYTKGIMRTTAKHTTISLSQTDGKEKELFMISALATDLDKYLRRKWNLMQGVKF